MNTSGNSVAPAVAGDAADASADPDPSDQRLTVSIGVEAPDVPPASWLRDRLDAAMVELGITGATLGFVVVDDAAMAELHQRFSGIAGTTDVLTFDLREHLSGPIEGEVYICLDEARRQAAERAGEPARELLLYALHGLLHLLGYDDHEQADHDRMHAKEDQVLEAIGVGRVYGG